MPKLVRLYIIEVITGFVISAAFVALLMGFNVANLRHLIGTSDVGLLALFLLWLFNGIVFSGVQFGITIMGMAEADGRDGGKGDDLVPGEPVRVTVHAKGRFGDGGPLQP